MEQLDALPLACQQKADDVHAHDGDLLEIEGGAGTAEVQLPGTLSEVLGLRGSDHPDDPPSAVGAALELERHPSPAFSAPGEQSAGQRLRTALGLVPPLARQLL